MEFSDGIVPLSEIRRAKNNNILDYCAKHKIKLAKNEKGENVLLGREHVVISDYEWVNNRNKTRGTLIELVAAHDNTSLLRAISKINHNPQLLLLEHHFGEEKRKFTSFYIPKEDQMPYAQALGRVSGFLKAFGAKPDFAESLMKKRQVEVRKNGDIRLFPENDSSGAIEFSENGNGKWEKRGVGDLTKPFFARHTEGRSAVIFRDPFQFMRMNPVSLFTDRKSNVGALVMMSDDLKALDLFLGQNPKVKKVSVVADDAPSGMPPRDMFSESLRKRYDLFEIKVETVSQTRSLDLGGRGLKI